MTGRRGPRTIIPRSSETLVDLDHLSRVDYCRFGLDHDEWTLGVPSVLQHRKNLYLNKIRYRLKHNVTHTVKPHLRHWTCGSTTSRGPKCEVSRDDQELIRTSRVESLMRGKREGVPCEEGGREGESSGTDQEWRESTKEST